MNWAIAEGYELGANPVQGTNRPTEQSRNRVLCDPELAAMWRACADQDHGRVGRLLMLTAQRREEVGGLRWDELGLAQTAWTIPRARTKNARVHFVPLVPALASIPPKPKDAPYSATLAGASRVGAVAERGVAAWRLHDLRRTATRMADLGVPPHVIEAVLNHVSGHKERCGRLQSSEVPGGSPRGADKVGRACRGNRGRMSKSWGLLMRQLMAARATKSSTPRRRSWS